jgi:hypothetical protein
MGTGEAGGPHNHNHLQMMNMGMGWGYEDDAQVIHVVWAIDSGKFFLCSFLIFYHSTNFYFHYIEVLSYNNMMTPTNIPAPPPADGGLPNHDGLHTSCTHNATQTTFIDNQNILGRDPTIDNDDWHLDATMTADQ